MLFLYLYDLPNSTGGIDQILVNTASSLPSFTPLLLAFIFFTIFLGGISRQKTRTGTSDYAMWAVISSMSVLMITLILSTIEGIVRLDWLAVVVTITIFSGVWLFLDKKSSDI